ncbi:hypothetical protein BC937DRAFT_86578, partial [Endogone sp. FLAS-F59071]
DIIRSRPRPSSSKSCPLFTKSKSSNGNLSGRTPSRSLSTSASAGPKSILGRPKSVKKSTSKAVVFDFSIAATKPLTPRVKPSDKKTPKAKGVSNKTIVAAITPEITPEIAIFKPDVRDENVVVGETPEVKEETPEVKEEAPEVKEEAPEVKEETLEVKGETLEVKGETLEVKEETLEVKEENPEVKEQIPIMPEDFVKIVELTPDVQGQVSDVADTFPKEDIPAVQEENVIIDTLQTDEQSVSDMNHTQQSAETDSVEITGVIDVPILLETQPMVELEGATLPIPSEAIQTALSDADIAAASDTIPTSPSEITISGDATELPSATTKVSTFDLLPPTTPTEVDSYYYKTSASPVSQSTPVISRRSMWIEHVKLVAKKLIASKSSSSVPSGGRRTRKFPAPELMTPMPRSDIPPAYTDEKHRKRMSWPSSRRADSIKSTSRNSNADLVSISESTDVASENGTFRSVSTFQKKANRSSSLFKKIVGKDKVDVEGGEWRGKKEKKGKKV